MADQEDKAEEQLEREADDAEMMARLREEIENLPVSEHVVYMMHSFSTLAIGRLGLTADTAARRDLGQARLAIDAFKALLVVLEEVLPAGEVAAHRGMLSQLQLAYAGATDRDQTAASADASAAESGRSAAGEGEASPADREPSSEEKKPASTRERPETAPKKTTTTPNKISKPKKPPAAAKKTTTAPKKTSKPKKSQ